MSNFFKNFGKGLLYILAFPFILVGLALYCVFGLFVYIFQLFKLVFLFFTGRTLFTDLEEDIRAKTILSKPTEEKEEQPAPQLSLYPSDSSIYDGEYSSNFIRRDEDEEKIDDDKEDEDHDDF